MTEGDPSIDLIGVAWRLFATMFFVVLNGFFVAAEFALVKVRPTRIETLEAEGSRPAKSVGHILAYLDLYLSACQLGITVASLVLGWLAEPAIAALIIAVLELMGVQGDPKVVHAIAIAFALSFVTVLHVTIGEQAPKIWAIQNSEVAALRIAYPLRFFTVLFRPFIRFINFVSNAMLRLAGIRTANEHDGVLDPDEIKAILATSARAGTISPRQREFAQNILTMMQLEVRHILVPRVDVVHLSLRNDAEENLELVRSAEHSRFPVCRDDLDSVVGMVHARDILRKLARHEPVDFEALVRPTPFVSDTQPLGRMIRDMQKSHQHAAVVLDEHGTAIGLAFLEDALEEIVGPIHDEFDKEEPPDLKALGGGSFDVPGYMAVPEAEEVLGLSELGDDDTIGGVVVSELGRLPKTGDQLQIGPYMVTVTHVDDHNRIDRLRFDKQEPTEA